ncbi:3'-5' exonuclease [Candidatus Kinetoplastibacterium desouzaii TCC079E]|uniref:3'-5' exonuclease n=1 Tax=Candidatus Kinetoplastidibacterium desouzai TCC079E TaxID=1208919 RepID=M1L246_9PROT|nr:3'-5' exonuclease [Candidatus Kinetoplastibacterium desouzaii]AGF46823.1 3'-5' exonuclease [Candidatus Kinetoplastibacterium desouzaii TCC079E]
MKNILVFDIETIPDIDGLKKIRNFDDGLSESEIFNMIRLERLEKFGHDFLPLHLHKIIAISCLFRYKNDLKIKTLGNIYDNEEKIISLFFKIIDRYNSQIVTWNGSGFDLPVIHYRSLIHGISSARYWDTGHHNKDAKFNNYINRYHNKHLDLMDVLAKYNARSNVPMDEIAKLCGFPGKIGMDGSMVWDYWCNGQVDTIRAYCETDVVNTWLLYCRFLMLKEDIDLLSYNRELILLREEISNLRGEHWANFINSWDTI